MQGHTVNVLRSLLYPVRRLMDKFILLPEDAGLSDMLIYKAAAFVAADQIEGDYLEFGLYAGGSFIQAYKCLNA